MAKDGIESRAGFVGLLSHKLKTPLTSLKLKLQLSQRLLVERRLTLAAIEQLKNLLDNADRDVGRITEILDEHSASKPND